MMSLLRYCYYACFVTSLSHRLPTRYGCLHVAGAAIYARHYADAHIRADIVVTGHASYHVPPL